MNRKPLPRTSLEPVCAALAEVIRARRVARGWSPELLAQFTNLSRPGIEGVEKSKSVPTLDTIARISRAFGLPVSQLLAEAERRIAA